MLVCHHTALAIDEECSCLDEDRPFFGTLIAFPGEEECHILRAGNPGMAKGGSGDVLTGVMAAMLGQLPFREAVLTGAWLHSAAGDECAAERGEYGMTPSDVIEKLPYIMKEITR